MLPLLFPLARFAGRNPLAGFITTAIGKFFRRGPPFTAFMTLLFLDFFYVEFKFFDS